MIQGNANTEGTGCVRGHRDLEPALTRALSCLCWGVCGCACVCMCVLMLCACVCLSRGPCIHRDHVFISCNSRKSGFLLSISRLFICPSITSKKTSFPLLWFKCNGIEERKFVGFLMSIKISFKFCILITEGMNSTQLRPPHKSI